MKKRSDVSLRTTEGSEAIQTVKIVVRPMLTIPSESRGASQKTLAMTLLVEPVNWLTGTPANLKAGQALVELAVFGAFFLFILGVLLSYGIKYNYQQNAQMKAFRDAFAGAASNGEGAGSASVVYIEDRMIPEPGDAFGIGSVSSMSSSASVTKTWHAHWAPETNADAPTVDITVRGGGTRRLITARYRQEMLIPKAAIPKYKQIFGVVQAGGENPSVGWVSTTSDRIGTSGSCPSNTISDVYDFFGIHSSCYFNQIRILDECEGEVIDYDFCRDRAQQITNPAYCQKKCEASKPRGTEIKCDEICAVELYGHDGIEPLPWYAVPGALDAAFGFVPGSNKSRHSTGLQPATRVNIDRNLTLRKQETADAVVTGESGDWSQTTTRTIVTQSGRSWRGAVVTQSEGSIVASVGDSMNETWRTEK